MHFLPPLCCEEKGKERKESAPLLMERKKKSTSGERGIGEVLSTIPPRGSGKKELDPFDFYNLCL